jgi:nascent polypeptide-associated complex subunit alpha
MPIPEESIFTLAVLRPQDTPSLSAVPNSTTKNIPTLLFLSVPPINTFLDSLRLSTEAFYSISSLFFSMFPGMNPKLLKDAMKKMGIKQEEIPALEVIIKTPDRDLVIHNPQVAKVIAMGQETFQITGDLEEVSPQRFSEDDVKTVASQTGVSAAAARAALMKTKGDLAQAILELRQ